MKGKTMTTEQQTIVDLFASRLEAAEEARQCAHVTFPEVDATGWIPFLLEEVIGALGAMLATDGMTLPMLEDSARHALILVAAAGMAAGKADASDMLVSLSEVDWDNLPDIFGDDEGTTGRE